MLLENVLFIDFIEHLLHQMYRNKISFLTFSGRFGCRLMFTEILLNDSSDILPIQQTTRFISQGFTDMFATLNNITELYIDMVFGMDDNDFNILQLCFH